MFEDFWQISDDFCSTFVVSYCCEVVLEPQDDWDISPHFWWPV
jgi:hypothetical protein